VIIPPSGFWEDLSFFEKLIEAGNRLKGEKL